MIRTYEELISFKTFEERLEYAKCDGIIGMITFGSDRYINQSFYNSKIWKDIRREVIIRDNGLDLAHRDHPISGKIYIHHLNPITIDDLLNESDKVYNPLYLISCSIDTHNFLHYGKFLHNKKSETTVRKPNDTCLWR